jgi:hypothetical protein
MIQYVFTEKQSITLRSYVTSKILEDMGRIWEVSCSRSRVSTRSSAEEHNEKIVLILPDERRRTELHLLHSRWLHNEQRRYLCLTNIVWTESTSTFWFISVKGSCCWPSFWIFISLWKFYWWFPQHGNSKFLNPKLVCIYRPQNQKEYN